jgi:hypothetical protein
MATKKQLDGKLGASLDQLAHFVTARPEVRLKTNPQKYSSRKLSCRLTGISKDEAPFPVRITFYDKETGEEVGVEWAAPESVILVLRPFEEVATPSVLTGLASYLQLRITQGNNPETWTELEGEFRPFDGEQTAIYVTGYNPRMGERRSMFWLNRGWVTNTSRSDWDMSPFYLDFLRRRRFPAGLSPENYILQPTVLAEATATHG